MTSSPAPQLHPDVQPFVFMLGTWRGRGEGSYPTIDDFTYMEEVSFSHVGKPFLAYTQKTRHGETGLSLHAESGYWRFPGPGRVEAVLSHPTGITEVEEGTVELGLDGSIVMRLATTAVSLTSSAKSVTGLERVVRVSGDELRYDVSMAAVGVPMQHHLSALLVREHHD